MSFLLIARLQKLYDFVSENNNLLKKPHSVTLF